MTATKVSLILGRQLPKVGYEFSTPRGSTEFTIESPHMIASIMQNSLTSSAGERKADGLYDPGSSPNGGKKS